MKNLLKIILSAIIIISVFQLRAQNAFSKGVNVTGWFGAGNAKSIPFNRFNKQDIQNIKSLGCDVIRLPIELHHFTSGAPDYVIDTLFFHYLDQVIDWTEELQMNLIIDNHTIEVATSKTVEVPLLKIWPQMAEHYKNRSTSVFYEILNEPNAMLASDWASIQVKVVNAIRAIDTKHTIVVTGADWGGISGLLALKKLADPNLIYSFHFYDPFLFTHQGAGWPNPSLADLGGVPFPYDATRMPACPPSLKGTWVESSLANAYKNDGKVATLKTTIDRAINYAKNNNVKIFCGEMGVFNSKSLDADRVNWYKEVAGYLTLKTVPWTMWDYQGGFGLFNKGSNEVFEYDINRPMADGMGFTPPPFKQYVFKVDSVPFDIYTDFPGAGIVQGGVGDVFCSEVYQGIYSVLFTDVNQYQSLDFDFKFNKDLSKLLAANYKVEFWMKADSPGSSIVLRFLDTKTDDPKDHPWRRDFTINSSVAAFDGQWHFVQIPLKKFLEAGSWDGTWFNATNSFDWKAVDRFAIVSETMPLAGKKFWFDDIRINGTPITGVEELNADLNMNSTVYPNPFTQGTTIEYTLPQTSTVDVSIYNLDGRKLVTLVNGQESTGKHRVEWTPSGTGSPKISEGIYLCKISTPLKSEIVKLIYQNQ